MSERLPKEFRLSGLTKTDRLFRLGQSLKAWPFKLVYLLEPAAGPALPQVLFSVPKRQHKRATERNLIRRRCREAYRKQVRLHLLPAVQTRGQALLLAFIYTGGKTSVSAADLEKKLSGALKRLALELAPPSQNTGAEPAPN